MVKKKGPSTAKAGASTHLRGQERRASGSLRQRSAEGSALGSSVLVSHEIYMTVARLSIGE
jgi:hypothetical protein